MVDDQVVRNAYDPGQKSAIIPVFSAPQRLDNFDKCFLKKIFSQLLIFNGQQNVGIHLAPVPVN
jgi:hypothetical protein